MIELGHMEAYRVAARRAVEAMKQQRGLEADIAERQMAANT